MNEKSLFLLSIKQVFFFDWFVKSVKNQKSNQQQHNDLLDLRRPFLSPSRSKVWEPFFNKLKDVPNFLQSETNFKNKSAYCLDKKIWDIFEKIELKVL